MTLRDGKRATAAENNVMGHKAIDRERNPAANAQGLVPGERQGSLMNSSSINLESPLMTTITPTR
jgi:hypothetical protein